MKSVIKGKSKLMSEPEPKLFESRSGNKSFGSTFTTLPVRMTRRFISREL
jgi:hypothetical protein